ncbi:unnamed protein product [Victoria cruziana]
MEASFHINRSFTCSRKPFLDGARWGTMPSSIALQSKGFSGFKIPSSTIVTSEYSRKQQRRTAKPKAPFSKGHSPSSTSKSKTDRRTQKRVQTDEKTEIRSQNLKETSRKHVSKRVQTSESSSSGVPDDGSKEVKLDLLEAKQSKDEPEVGQMASTIKSTGLEPLVRRAVSSGDELGSTISTTTVSEFGVASEKLVKGGPELENLEVRDESVPVAEVLLKDALENDMAKKDLLENLACSNLSSGNRIFIYPDVAKANHDIEVFLNRKMSALENEPNVLIMGAFNGWRWRSFTKPLQKTELQGDWWYCKVHIPKEAYKMDFVFFNGDKLYENNNLQDFFVPVEGGMDISHFEDFLLEEKRREIEKLAAEQAEREKRAAEQRRLEEEKAASEADRLQAKNEVERRREMLQQMIGKAVNSVHDQWYIQPSQFRGGDEVKIYYNRNSGPLAHSGEVWIHGGHNNWQDGLTIVERLDHSEGGWWSADVTVPDHALLLDWVFTDGPPGHAKVYDNNKRQDFHAVAAQSVPEVQYWLEEEHHIYKKLRQERKLKEEAKRLKAEKTAHMKAETKARTLKTFLLSQKHIVYTDPLDVQAGYPVTIFYNPSNTVLSGKSEIWIRCSFNRWTHSLGSLTQKMIPFDSSSRVKATVKVPLDAYLMDFVFSEREDGGVYDNKNGMDYHVPVVGGVAREPPMHIVHIAVEMAPIAKVGGLGDVVTSLSRAVKELGHNVEIILPKYDCMNYTNVKDMQFKREFGWGRTQIKVWFGKVEGLPVYFLEPQNGMFSVRCIYGCKNDGERFGFFCHAALEFLQQSGSHPDILHCHDWSSAPVAWLFKENYKHYGLSNSRVVFTIHNLEFGAGLVGKAMTHVDKATTVSHTYSREISSNPTVSPHLYKFHGILNGIDPDIWDPYNDPYIPVSYTSANVVEGKKAAKEALQQRLGLRKSDHPLVGIITRLTVQKGIHLIKHAIWQTLERNGQVVLLGSAPDPRIQNDFVNLANQLHSKHSDQARLCLTYDEPLSHLIYAGADLILVPSLFEPCGLTQLIAMRYGSVPVVRRTGGTFFQPYIVPCYFWQHLSLLINFTFISCGGLNGNVIFYKILVIYIYISVYLHIFCVYITCVHVYI